MVDRDHDTTRDAEAEEMIDTNNQIIIYCPFCKAPITVDELGEYVNANPDIRKQAIEEQFQVWGGAYDRSYLIQM